MPMLEEVAGPYELLFRGDQIARTLLGQHQQTATSILRDGVIVPGATTINPPMPITSETATTVAEVCEMLNTAALVRITDPGAQLADALAERDKAVARARLAEAVAQPSA